jgi:ribosomal protein L31
MRKRDIHPEWYPEAKVFCNGVEVMTVGGTKETYNVDVYSGNHPFYQVSGGAIVVNSNSSSDMQVDTQLSCTVVGAASRQQWNFPEPTRVELVGCRGQVSVSAHAGCVATCHVLRPGDGSVTFSGIAVA